MQRFIKINSLKILRQPLISAKITLNSFAYSSKLPIWLYLMGIHQQVEDHIHQDKTYNVHTIDTAINTLVTHYYNKEHLKGPRFSMTGKVKLQRQTFASATILLAKLKANRIQFCDNSINISCYFQLYYFVFTITKHKLARHITIVYMKIMPKLLLAFTGRARIAGLMITC